MDGDKFVPRQIQKFNAFPEYHLGFVKTGDEEVNSKFLLIVRQSQPSRNRVAELSGSLSKIASFTREPSNHFQCI